MLGSTLSLVLASNSNLQVTSTVRGDKDFKTMPNSINWIKFDLNQFTVSSLSNLLQQYDYVVNCLGYIKQRSGKCTTFLSSEMFSSNSVFPLVIDYLSGHLDFKVYQIGTDCVFDGKKGFYSEKSEITGMDDYGLSKALMENRLNNSMVLRCSIIGPEFRNKLSLLEWFLNQPNKAILNGFTNHYWNGISTYHFAKIINGCLDFDEQRNGTFHIIPQDAVSKYQLLCLVREIFDRQDIQIIPYEDLISVNRVLQTKFAKENLRFWSQAGYKEPPSIKTIIEECRGFVEEYRKKFRIET